MKKVAILASPSLLPSPNSLERRGDAFELDEQIALLKPVFKRKGMELDVLMWQTAPSVADQYDIMLPLFAWDYVEGENPKLFIATMEKIAKKTKLANSLDILLWNGTKTYLTSLQQKGAPTIPSIIVPSATEEEIQKAFTFFGDDCEQIVIKPLIGANSWRQVLYKKGSPFPNANDLPPNAAVVQPFLHCIQTEGEYSFLYFGAQFSHAVRKLPKKGDYRIQCMYGGYEMEYEPTEEEIQLGAKLLTMLDCSPPLYARIDLLRGNDGLLKLMELEMIEPYLYMSHASQKDGKNRGAELFAAVLSKFITVPE